MMKFQRIASDCSIEDIHQPLLCSFGIISGPLIAGLIDLGVGAETAGIIGTVGAGAIAGGGIGALTDPKNPLQGAEAGAITGGVASGLAPVIGSATGWGATAADAAAGVVGGGLGAAITGQNVLSDAATGGLSGAVSGAISSSFAPGGSEATPPSGGPVGSAASTAAPASVPLGSAGGDVTAGVNAGGVGAGNITADSAAALTGGAAPPTIGTSLSAGTPSGAISGGGGVPVLGSPAPGGGINYTGGGLPGGVQVTGADVPNFPSSNLGSISPTTPSIPTPSIGSQIGSFVKDNSWLLPAGALGLAALESQKKLPGEAQLNASAQNLTNLASTNENYLQTGTLPPGVQQGIDRASAAATASIRSQYASTIGSGTSSAEQQDIAAVHERAAVDGANIAVSLLQQGVSEQGMADQLYQDLMNNALQQDQALGNALGAFAGALVPATLLSKAA